MDHVFEHQVIHSGTIHHPCCNSADGIVMAVCVDNVREERLRCVAEPENDRTGVQPPRETHWIRECELCGHRYAKLEPHEDHIELVYADDYFMGDGAGYPDYLAQGGLLVSHGKRYARLLSRHMGPGSVLDVGAAAGFILKGSSVIGVM